MRTLGFLDSREKEAAEGMRGRREGKGERGPTPAIKSILSSWGGKITVENMFG